MANVFVSYAREDGDAVDLLVDELSASGHHVWRDVTNIEPSEPWRERIRDAIDAADVVLAVLSPAALRSREVAAEIAYADEQHKRLVPLLVADLDGAEPPRAVAELNWILCRRQDDRRHALDVLERALQLDLEFAQVHASVLTRARAWERPGRQRGMLLRAGELVAAERWLDAAAGGAEPQPTALQREFVAASRRATARRQRQAAGSATLVAAVAIALAVFAFVQRGQARHAADVSRSRELAARAESIVGTDPEAAIPLAMHAVETVPTILATHTLGHALDASRMRGRLLAGGPVGAVAFSPDGSALVAGGVAGTLRRWDGADMRRRWTAYTREAVGGVSFSRDGRLLLVTRATAAGMRTVELRDARTGRLVRTLQHSAQPGDCCALAHWVGGTHLVAVIAASNLVLVDGDSGRVARTIASTRPAPGFAVFGLAVTTDGDRAAVSGADGTIRVVSLPDGRLITTAKPRSLKAASIAFSPDGTRLAIGAQGGAEVIDLRYPEVYGGGHLQFQLRGSTYFVSDVAWSPDGRLVAAATKDPGIYVWNATSGREIATLNGSTLTDDAVAFSPRGTLASGGSDGVVQLWDPEADHWTKRVRVAPDGQLTESFAVTNAKLAAFVQPDRLVVVDAHGDLRTRRRIDIATPHAIAADGLVGFAFADRVALESLVAGTPRGSLPLSVPAGLRPATLALSADGRRAAVVAARLADANIVQPRGAVLVASAEGSRRVPGVMADRVLLSADGRRLVAADAGSIALVSTDTLRVDRRLRGLPLAFTADGRQLAVLRDHNAIVLEALDGGSAARVLRSVPPDPRASFSPDGRLLTASGIDGTVRVWDLRDGTQVRTLHVREQYAYGGDRLVLPAAVLLDSARLLIGVNDEVLSYPACDDCRPAGALLAAARARLAAIRLH